jgi:hypothetical protein
MTISKRTQRKLNRDQYHYADLFKLRNDDNPSVNVRAKCDKLGAVEIEFWFHGKEQMRMTR